MSMLQATKYCLPTIDGNDNQILDPYLGTKDRFTRAEEEHLEKCAAENPKNWKQTRNAFLSAVEQLGPRLSELYKTMPEKQCIRRLREKYHYLRRKELKR